MAFKFKNILGRRKPSMSFKLTAAICSIVVILLVAAILSIMEFRRMNNYMSDIMAENIHKMNLSASLAVTADRYNLDILSVVGDADSIVVSNLDCEPYISAMDSIVHCFVNAGLDGADSLAATYERYAGTARQLDTVIVNDFIDTRDWYFTVLQPRYNDFRASQEVLDDGIYKELKDNSSSLDESFYRSIMPGNVSVAAAVILALLLLFFILVFYIRPLRRILSGIDSYRHFSQPYNNVFEGDDELKELNDGVGDLIDENINLKKRLRNRER